MKQKTLVILPINGDYEKQLAFEEEFGFIKIHSFYNHLDLVKTLKRNRITYGRNYPDSMIIDSGLSKYGIRMFDHYYIASTKNHKYYFVSEPYIGEPTYHSYYDDAVWFTYEETVADVARWCREKNLSLEIRQHGPHCKVTDTTMFIITAF